MKYLEIKIVKELQDMYTEYHKNITGKKKEKKITESS